MKPERTLFVQFIVHFLSVIANIFGLFCLRQQEKNKKKRSRCECEGNGLLLQNIALVEILKMSYDVIPLAVFHYEGNWYTLYTLYFDLIEMFTMTVFFTAFLLILLDKVIVCF